MYINKWMTITGSCFMQLFISGILYGFSIYAHALKQAFQWDQTQIQSIAVPPVSAGYFAWVPGVMYDALADHHKAGPRCACKTLTLIHPVP